jgi:hypothetical protein
MSVSPDPTPDAGSSPKAPFRENEAFQQNEPFQKNEPFHDVTRAGNSESDATLPIPMGPLRSQLTMPRNDAPRPSLWRRITMRKRSEETTTSAEAEATVIRLGAIDLHLEQLTMTLSEGLGALNERFSEVWEPEEQLSHLADIQDKLDQLGQDQAALSKAVADLRRILGWTAGLVIVAAAGLGFLLSQL